MYHFFSLMARSEATSFDVIVLLTMIFVVKATRIKEKFLHCHLKIYIDLSFFCFLIFADIGDIYEIVRI